jgi:parallel beta-helix repeat protein
VSIVGNTIDTTTAGQHGIQLVNVSRVTVGDNVVANVAATGISSENLNNTVLSGNVIWTPAARGITVISSDNSNVVGNQVRDAGNEGILLQTSSYIQVRDNFVKGASKASNGASSGIRASDGQDALVFSGNTVRPNSANTNKQSYGLSIGTGTNMSHWGNDCRQLGGTNLNGSITDGSTTPSTAATDLT